MIIYLNDTSYTYDVHSLFKAFYPEADVEVSDQDPGGSEASVFVTGETITLRMGDEEYTSSIGGLPRAEAKNVLKRMIYDALSVREGRELPWGTLTGIRPVKLLRRALEAGEEQEETFHRLKDTYRISDEKLTLAHRIARREQRILAGLRREGAYSLYIGIPFCPSICLYCSFSSYPIGVYQDRVEAYLGALDRELSYVGEAFRDRPLDTVYVGGGTPTSLSAGQLETLLDSVQRHINLEGIREFTIEAGRPDSLTPEKLSVIRDFGDVRISINPQTMNEKTLQLIGRAHSCRDVYRCFRQAREAGFNNINMDLIVGLPGEGPEEVDHTLREVEALCPDNLTVHSLAIKRSSRLNLEIDRYRAAIVGNSNEIMERVHKTAENLHMHPYYLYRQKNIAGNLENIGFATEGREGIYNVAIMEEVQDIVACGAGAVSKRVYSDRKNARAANIKDVDLYIAKIDEMIQRKRELYVGE